LLMERLVDSCPVPVRHSASRCRGSSASQCGFSMIEVLVVILVLSFGMLGIAGLQANTTKFKINSWARAAASIQFSDLADRVRANPAQAGDAFTQGASPGTASSYVLTRSWALQQADDLAISTNCLTTTCTAAQRATYDMLAWRASARRLFPQGAAVVEGNRATGISASIAWFDRQFTRSDGSLDSSAVCTAAMTGAARAGCCPQALGNPIPAGVRCTNLSFVP
jgi:type IV pilus assembly protein PilV